MGLQYGSYLHFGRLKQSSGEVPAWRPKSCPLPSLGPSPVFGPRIAPVLLLIAIAQNAAIGESPSTAADSQRLTETRWQRDGWPLLQKYCIDCHNEDYSEAELDLSSFHSFAAFSDESGSMQRVLEMVRFGAMPPEDSDLPTEDERKRLVAALDQSLYSVSCDLRVRPGKVTARRLNRAEYNRTVRDLFGLDRFDEVIRPADRFPSDEVGEGFDNNSDVLSMSPMLMEKYLSAAETIAAAVIVDAEQLPSVDHQRTADQLLIHGDVAAGLFRGHCVTPETKVWTTFHVPIAGEYELAFVGGSNSKTSDQLVELYDGDGKILAREKIGHFGGRAKGKSFKTKIHLDPGDHVVFARLVGEHDNLIEVGQHVHPDRVRVTKSMKSKAIKQTRSPRKPQQSIDPNKFPLMIRKLILSGPVEYLPDVFPPTQSEIIRYEADEKDGQWKNVAESARKSLKPLLVKAFRRPIENGEVDPYVALVVDATERGESYHRGIQIAVTAILVSPNFLFRIETPLPSTIETLDAQKINGDDSPGTIELTQHQLASRLSYFLYSSMPDPPLFTAADQGQLAGDRLEREVKRMLQDPKSDSLASQFAAQWLGLKNLEVHEADTDKFPGFNRELADAMSRETQLVFSNIVSKNRPVVELLTADYSFINPLLASHYGIDLKGDAGKKTDQRFARVSLADSPRRGVLSHASVLTLTSNPGRTSPVKRGKWILENVFGTPPPEPPPGIPELEDSESASEHASLREQLEAHRADPACAACHRVMDQLGFGLEQFDAVGRFREFDGTREVDSSGELPGGRSFDGGRELVEVLGETEQDAFAQTVISRLLTFALGRGLLPGDRCVIDEIAANTRKRGYRMQDMMIEVVKSQPFQTYEWVGPESIDRKIPTAKASGL